MDNNTEENKKIYLQYADLTEEQKKGFKRIIITYYLRSLWNGISHGLLGILMLIVCLLADNLFFGKSMLMSVILIAIVYTFIFYRVRSLQDDHLAIFRSDFEKIIKK